MLRKVKDCLVGEDGPPRATGIWRQGQYRRFRQLWIQFTVADGILYRVRKPGPQREAIQVAVIPENCLLHHSPLCNCPVVTRRNLEGTPASAEDDLGDW